MPKRRRRSFTAEFKAQVVLEVLASLSSQAEVALEGLESLFQSGERRDQDQGRIAELERMVGRLTMELEVAKKASTLLPSALRRDVRPS
jgi:transposase-like protein